MHTEFDIEMKRLESYSGLKVPDRAYTILRIDGRGFSGFTEKAGYTKPFDQRFHDVMGYTTRVLVENLQAEFGYHQSDEISIFLNRGNDLFDREVLKLVSISAGLASSVFARNMDEHIEEYPHFDSRVIAAATDEQVTRYLHWRVEDATRNCLNTYCHWTAVLKDGKTATQAARIFNKQTQKFKHDFLFERGINFNELPGWQKRGSLLTWEKYQKQGFNPVTSEVTVATRRRVVSNEAPRGLDLLKVCLDQMFKVPS